jgi:hypothetical protein
MGCRGMLRVLGVVAGAAVTFSPAALADDFFPPGTIGPIDGPTYAYDIYASPFFHASQYDGLYNVMDGDDSLGQFTNTSTYFISPYQPFGVWFSDSKDVISDSTYAGLADGATQDHFSVDTLTLTGNLVLFGNEYYDNPGIATSDYLTLFGTRFPLWDITYDAAGGAATEPGGLGDLFGVDPSSLGDLLGVDPGGLGDLFGLDPSALTDFLGIDPGGLADFAALF